MNNPHMLLIGGRSGVGKSTVAFAIHGLLSARGVQHAVIEGDALDLAYPAPWKQQMAERNLRAIWRVLLQLGAGAKKAPFLLCDQRYVPVLSGRLEYPANNHCIRIRVTIGKHRALPLPQ